MMLILLMGAGFAEQRDVWRHKEGFAFVFDEVDFAVVEV